MTEEWTRERETSVYHTLTRWMRTGQFSGDQRAPRGWRAVIKHDPCSYCGGPGGHVDHILARSQGGNGSVWNMAGACGSCNSSKHTVPLLAFLLLRPLTEQQVQLEYQRQAYLSMAPRRAARQSSIRTVNTRPRPRR